ncbi:MAG TPA: ATP-binding protein [Candidatus Dormibacteraeota bacterium]|nr:ATP-binding protein [Candidatus Dormibacteraeota bacterium]
MEDQPSRARPGPPADGRVGAPRSTAPALDGRQVAAILHAGLLHFDRSRLIDEANDVAHELLAVAPGRLLGRTPLEAFLDRRVDELVSSVPVDGPRSLEIVLRDGGARVVIVHARPDAAGGAWLVLEDVAELRRLQRIRTEFIDNLSHELRTPLSSIALLTETLAAEATAHTDMVTPRMRDRIAKIQVETSNLAQMVDEMLDLSRIESGGAMRMDDLLDLGVLASEAARRLGPFAERQGVALRVEVADDVPMLRGNEQRLGQVLLNLVHNAVKFSPDGGEVVIRVGHDDGSVSAAVEDHGIGIERSDLPRIFERFYKADRARVRGGGTGLGLSIARHIVEAHGGTITVATEIGRGSTFTLRLPLPASPDPAPSSPDANAATAAIPAGEG